MKIVMIANTFSYNGGVAAYVIRLSQSLVKAEHDVLVIHQDENPIDVEGVRKKFVGGYTGYHKTIEDKETLEVLQILKDEAPDVVHIQANQNYALEKAIRKDYACLKSMHVHEYCPSGTKYHFATNSICEHKTGPMCLPRMFYKRCTKAKHPMELKMFYERSMKNEKNDIHHNKLIVASRYMKDNLLAGGYSEQRIEILPYFAEKPKKAVSPNWSKNALIMFSGRCVSEKGWRELIQAAFYIPRNKPWKLVVDSDGPDLEKAKALARKLDLSDRIEFPGWLDEGAHHQLYADATVVVVPSVWPEPFGLVGIEAMSYGKPTVAFSVGGIVDWIKHQQTGLLVHPYNLQEMGDKIGKILFKDKVAEELGGGALKRYQKYFTEEVHNEHLMRIYRQAIGLKDWDNNYDLKK